LKLEGPLHDDGKRFILVGNPMLYLTFQHYSRNPDECTFLLAADGAQELPTTRIQLNLAQYSPLQFWKLDDLKTHARETALIDPAPETLHAMRQAGFQVAVRFSEPLKVVYLQ
jgi:hypothetical protein